MFVRSPILVKLLSGRNVSGSNEQPGIRLDSWKDSRTLPNCMLGNGRDMQAVPQHPPMMFGHPVFRPFAKERRHVVGLKVIPVSDNG